MKTQHEILPEYEKLANLYMAKNVDESEQIFAKQKSVEDYKKIGSSFMNLILESIFVWSRWFPIDPDTKQFTEYKIAYERLILLKVRFPMINYFQFQLVKFNMPEEMIPKVMLRQMKGRLALELIQSKQIYAT